MGDGICLTGSNFVKWVYFSVAGLSGKFCKGAGFRLQGCRGVARVFTLYGVNGCRFARVLQGCCKGVCIFCVFCRTFCYG